MLTCGVTELRDLTFSRSRAPDERSSAVSLSGGLSDTDDDDTFRSDSPWSPENKATVLKSRLKLIMSRTRETAQTNTQDFIERARMV